MEMIQRLLSAYSWVVVGVLLVFLWRIAWFYGKASGERVGHATLLIPGFLLAAGAVWYMVWAIDFVGEFAGDLLLFGGGLGLWLFGFHLQNLMTGERK